MPIGLSAGLLKRHFLMVTVCLFAAVITTILFYSFYKPTDTAEVHFIDVGYGDAIFLETPDEQTILIDSGDTQHAGRLLEYLALHHVTRIDFAILTHPHKNHFEGFLSLIGRIPVGRFYINGDDTRAEEGYDDLMDAVRTAGIPVAVLKEGDRLPLTDGRTSLTILHPSILDRSANENALVTFFTFKKSSFLLTSDIQPPQQKALLERYPDIASAEVVQIPHHGGKISDRFAGSFAGDTYFVMSTGKNKYEKPFINELDKVKGTVFRTDINGTILLQSNGYKVKVADD